MDNLKINFSFTKRAIEYKLRTDLTGKQWEALKRRVYGSNIPDEVSDIIKDKIKEYFEDLDSEISDSK